VHRHPEGRDQRRVSPVKQRSIVVFVIYYLLAAMFVSVIIQRGNEVTDLCVRVDWQVRSSYRTR